MLVWSAFSHIRTEYAELRSTSPYSVRIREKTDQNNSEYGHFLRSVCIKFLSLIFLKDLTNINSVPFFLFSSGYVRILLIVNMICYCKSDYFIYQHRK